MLGNLFLPFIYNTPQEQRAAALVKLVSISEGKQYVDK